MEALQALPTFDPTTNANKLQQASRSTAAMSAFDPSFPNPYPDQKDTIFDGQDCASHIDHLAAAAAARGMAATNDDFGFHQIVNLVGRHYLHRDDLDLISSAAKRVGSIKAYSGHAHALPMGTTRQ